MSKAQNRAIGRILEKHGSFEKFQSTYCEETILSQKGFTKLNKNKDGRYLKKQLVDCGMIESKIRLEEIVGNISYKKYLTLKETIVSVNGRGVFWCPVKRSVFKYLSSSIKRIN
jgi:NAD-dependent SIR2 family protein deacetylase